MRDWEERAPKVNNDSNLNGLPRAHTIWHNSAVHDKVVLHKSSLKRL